MYKSTMVVYHSKELMNVFRQLKNLLSFWNLLEAFIVIIICPKVTAIKKHFILIYGGYLKIRFYSVFTMKKQSGYRMIKV